MLLLLACAEEPLPQAPEPPPLPAFGSVGPGGCQPLDLDRPGTLEACYGAAGLYSLTWTVPENESGRVLAELTALSHADLKAGEGARWEGDGYVLEVTRIGSQERFDLRRSP